jgi:hypothetical protein
MQRNQDAGLPLFAWEPPCKVIAYPLGNRTGKVRDVARKLIDKTTDRHAEYYRKQVTQGLIVQLEKIGLSETEQDEQIGAFWCKVEQEALRLTYHRPGAGSPNPRGSDGNKIDRGQPAAADAGGNAQ